MLLDEQISAASFSEQLATFAPGAVADWTAADLAERVDESWFAGRLRADGGIETNAGGLLF
ncbi:hypothetical protein [Sphingomonas sp. OTU376]|uniref:hypothetical protein n=1 Tax=Sphingomonas sp. OTU376 TaxID=3043863 RepID=UPI00313DE8D9